MQKRIILAAGHGGGDSGATGQGTTEAQQAIEITNRVADKLRADGQLEVVVVPHELNLSPTISWINDRYKNLDDGYCLEIHKNSGAGGHGVEVWYFSDDVQSQTKAQQVLNGLVQVTGLPNRGVKGDATNRWGRLGFIRDTNPWAGLAECGFITDGGDYLDPERYAEGLKIGILSLWGLSPKAAPAPTPAPVQIKYRVYDSANKQVGAYNTEDGAWNKYNSGEGTKILDASGKDVTSVFVAKYRPVTAQPTPEPSDLEKRVGVLEATLKAVTDFLDKLFKNWSK